MPAVPAAPALTVIGVLAALAGMHGLKVMVCPGPGVVIGLTYSRKFRVPPLVPVMVAGTTVPADAAASISTPQIYTVWEAVPTGSVALNAVVVPVAEIVLAMLLNGYSPVIVTRPGAAVSNSAREGVVAMQNAATQGRSLFMAWEPQI
jgi:hypothetical protein